LLKMVLSDALTDAACLLPLLRAEPAP